MAGSTWGGRVVSKGRGLRLGRDAQAVALCFSQAAALQERQPAAALAGQPT
jgi:hypothetical protein